MSELNNIDQSAFDIITTRLLAQNAKSYINGSTSDCAYRGGNGTKCAVGHLISDADYVPEMDNDGISVDTLIQEFSYIPSIQELSKVNMALLIDLQSSHDHVEINYWPKSFARIAKKHNLKFNNIG